MNNQLLLPASLVASLVLAIHAAAADTPAKESAPAPPADQPVAPAEDVQVGGATIVIEGQAQVLDAAAAADDDDAPVGQGREMKIAGKALVEEDPQPYLGIGGSKVSPALQQHLNLPDDHGVLVESVDANGPAAKAGITKNDIVTKIDGKPVASQLEIANAVHAKKIGDEIDIESIHAGKPAKQKATLAQRPPGNPGGDAADDANPLLKQIPGLANMPPDQQKRIREALDNAMNNHGRVGAAGIQILPAAGNDNNAMKRGFQFKMDMSTNVQMMDQDGSVELKKVDGGQEAKVLDHAGKVVWSGSWDTAQDKAAAPPEIRTRIERINGTLKFNQIQPADKAPKADPPKARDEPK